MVNSFQAIDVSRLISKILFIFLSDGFYIESKAFRATPITAEYGMITQRRGIKILNANIVSLHFF